MKNKWLWPAYSCVYFYWLATSGSWKELDLLSILMLQLVTGFPFSFVPWMSHLFLKSNHVSIYTYIFNSFLSFFLWLPFSPLLSRWSAQHLECMTRLFKIWSDVFWDWESGRMLSESRLHLLPYMPTWCFFCKSIVCIWYRHLDFANSVSFVFRNLKHIWAAFIYLGCEHHLLL